MWLNFLFARSNSASARARRQPTSARLSVEALNDRILPSAVVPVPPTADAAVALRAGAILVLQQTLHVDGTFKVTDLHGSKLSATVDGYLFRDGADPKHYTINAEVKLMGNHIEGTPTMVFDDGSTLTFSYEIKVDRETGIYEGDFQITGGTGTFQGASGSGEICYPIAAAGPLMMDGTILV
jgi:hypothetical protein